MIPVGAIIGATMAARGKRAGGPKPERINAIFAILRLVMAFPVVMLWALSPALGAIIGFLYICTWIPSVVLTLVLVPLGLSRGAYFFTRVCTPFGHGRTPRGSGALYGMLAVLRRPEVDLARVDWLESKIKSEPVRSPTLTAFALIAFARRDRTRARDLFDIVLPIKSTGTPLIVRRLTLQWLMADAMQHGDWAGAAHIGRNTAYRWVTAARWMARRIAGERGAPSDLALRLAWLVAPHRAPTRPLLHRALAAPRRLHGADDLSPASPAIDATTNAPATTHAEVPRVKALDVALRAHASLLARKPGLTISSAAVAWDAVRTDPATQALFHRRALALGTQLGADTALVRMLTEAEADLTELCAATGPGPAVPSLTYFTVTERVRSEQLREVEYLSSAMKKRTIDQRDLAPVDEWLEWSHLRIATDRVLTGADAATKRAIFEVVYLPVCNHAVRLFNIRKQGLIAHTMFRWLLAMTKKTENPAAFKLLKKNSNASFVDY